MFNVIKFFELIISVVLLIDTIHTVFLRKIIINAHWCSYYVFQVFFIIPNIILLLCGRLDIRSYGYRFIYNNWKVEFVYTVFILFMYIMLKKSCLKHLNKMNIEIVQNIKIKIPFTIVFISLIGTIIPFLLVLISPQPNLYFDYFAAFERSNLSGIITDDARQWHNGILNIGLFLGMISCCILWVKSLNYKLNSRIILRLYLIIIGIVIVIFSSKRTLGTLLFIVYLMIDFLLKKKKPWLEAFFIIIGCVSYFIFYQYIVKKTVGGGISSPVEMYLIYFSRTLDYRFITYSLLNPSDVKILDYPCQSFLFDILPFIRRSNWSNKPYPFGVYYTAAWNNIQITKVSYRYTVSWFGEALANLSWIGIPVGFILYNTMLNIFEKFKNPIVCIFSIFVSVYFMVTHVQSNYINFIALFILYVFLEKKIIVKLFKR